MSQNPYAQAGQISVAKRSRNLEILDALESGRASLRQLAADYGISFQRVHQIAKRERERRARLTPQQ